MHEMSIQNELDTIKNAVYGKEVRGAIHDGIKKAYDDASVNGNANMEVEMARGIYKNLSERLLSVDKKLGNFSVLNINKNLGKLDETYMSDSFLSQIAGKTPISAVVKNESVTTNKIAQKAVTAEKLSDEIIQDKTGINLLDDSKSKKGGYYRFSDGVWQEDSIWRSSPPIRVTPSKTYVKKSAGNMFVYLDADFNFVSGHNNVGKDAITVPSNGDIFYVQYNLSNSLDPIGTRMFVEGTNYPTEYQAYQLTLTLNPDIKLKTEEKIKQLTDKVGGFVELPGSANLIDPTKYEKGVYYLHTNGSRVVDSAVTAIGPIPVEKNSTYSKETKSGQVTFWNEKDGFIKGLNIGDIKTFTTPDDDNLAYAMLATYHNVVPVGNAMLVKGETLPPNYVPYKPKKYMLPKDTYVLENSTQGEGATAKKLYMTPQIKEFERVQNPVLTKEIVTDRTGVTGLADPFLVMEKGRYHCFFEVLGGKNPVTSGVADEIGHAYSDNLIDWTYTQIILSSKEKGHRSAYPNVFKYDGEYYMVPDTVGNIKLYKAKNFPLEWDFIGDLKQGKYVDTNIFEVNGIWFMTTSEVITGQGANDLTLFYNDSGDWRNAAWVEHPLKHIIPQDATERGKRNAGKIFHGGDYIIMPLQITPTNTGVYGEYTDWIKLSNLSKTTCTVSNLGRAMQATKQANDWRRSAMHHISHVEHDNGFIYMVDGLDYPEYSLGLYQNV